MQGCLEDLFCAAFTTLSEAAFALDQEGRLVAGNAAFRTLFGISEIKETGLPFDQLCIDSDQARMNLSPIPMSNGQAAPRHRYRRRDGTIFWGERSDAPIQGDDGACLGVCSIIRDVSEQVILERGLKSLLALPAMGSQQAHHGMAKLIDLGCQHFGADHGSLSRFKGDHLIVDVIGGSWNLHHPGDILPLNETFGAVPRDREGLLTIEQCSLSKWAGYPYHHQTDLEFYLACEVQVGGRAFGMLSFADPLPRQRPLLEHDRLFLRIIAQWSGMLLESRMTREALNLATQDLDRFAHIASHDLQEPLRRVVTYCQILMEDFGTEVSEEAAEVIEIIQTGGKRMRLMLNDLLIYSRLNQQLQQAFEPVDMASILCHVIDDLGERLEQSEARIEIAHLPLVWGRAPLLQMVCYHLLSNAIKYAGDEAPEIDISIRDEGSSWQFRFADRGIGIEPRFADRIFDIFQRLHPRDNFSGSGVGLAICKLIIERHGGTILLDADYEKGACFLFTLPKSR